MCFNCFLYCCLPYRNISSRHQDTNLLGWRDEIVGWTSTFLDMWGPENLGTSSFVTFGGCTPLPRSITSKGTHAIGETRDIGSLLHCSPHRQIVTVSNHMTVFRMVEAYVGISNVFFSPCMNEKTCNYDYKRERARPKTQKPFLVSFWSQASLINRILCTYPSCSRL